MPRIITQEEFIEMLKSITNGKFELVGSYQSFKKKALIRHLECGYKWEVIPQNLLTYIQKGKYGCPCCAEKNRSKRKLKSQETYESEIKERWGEEYSILSEYKGTHKPIKVRHNTCGYEWEVSASSIRSGYGCPKCANNIKRSQEQYKQDVLRKLGKDYIILGQYKNADSKILTKHLTCGYEWETRAISLLKGFGCPKCAGKAKKTQAEFINEVYSIVGDEYTVLGEYTGKNNKVLMRHNICGNEWDVTPDNFLNGGTRCPYELRRKGEERIESWLKHNSFQYKSQFSFIDCCDKLPLRFDFAIFDEDKLILLIEFDGLQHDKVIEHFGGIQGFKDRKRKDEIKNRYCKEKGIHLLRIKYQDMNNIEELLDNLLIR